MSAAQDSLPPRRPAAAGLARRPRRFVGTYVALAVFAGLLAFALYGPRPEEKAADASLAATVMSFDRESLTELSVRGKDQTVRLRRDAAGQWALLEPRALPADQSRMTNLGYTLSSLDAQRKVADRAQQPADFGLEQPEYTVELGFQDGTRRTLLVGARAPVGSARYVKDAAAEPVYLVSDQTLEDLLGKPVDFMRKAVVDFSTADVERARFEGAGVAFEVRREQIKDGEGKEKEVWRLYRDAPAGAVAPAPAELKGGAEEALAAVRNLRAVDLPPEGDQAIRSGKGIETWRIEVSLKGKSEPLRLQFAAPAGEAPAQGGDQRAHVKRADEPHVFPLDAREAQDALARWKELGKTE